MIVKEHFYVFCKYLIFKSQTCMYMLYKIFVIF